MLPADADSDEELSLAWKKGFGYSLMMIRKNLRLGELPFFSLIQLSPADPITGRIVDPNGKPLNHIANSHRTPTAGDR